MLPYLHTHTSERTSHSPPMALHSFCDLTLPSIAHTVASASLDTSTHCSISSSHLIIATLNSISISRLVALVPIIPILRDHVHVISRSYYYARPMNAPMTIPSGTCHVSIAMNTLQTSPTSDLLERQPMEDPRIRMTRMPIASNYKGGSRRTASILHLPLYSELCAVRVVQVSDRASVNGPGIVTQYNVETSKGRSPYLMGF
ncbi:hypothetical protein C8Q80DRAFT_686242 [Daedaleopsis nitida]|nr:hypothetical protein C8Q80DRAFT_686242 [Daedaleopsis nitida]